MKGTTNAQRNAIVDSTSAVDSLTLTKADGTTQKHTVSDIIPKDDAPTSGSSKFVTSGAIYTALQGRVPVESGKGLSTNDYTTAEKSKVSNLPDNANTTFATKTELTDALSSVYKYKGSVNTYGNLPSNATAGDVYNVVASYNGVPAGTNWAWNGSSWDALGGTVTGYVADTTTVNGKPLSSNVTLTAADVSAVPTTRTVNGKALSGDISLSASDVGALASGGTAAKATADASGNNIVNTYATKAELTNGLAGKQNSLTFDSAPTSGSSNPVTSGGVYSAINTIDNRVKATVKDASYSGNVLTLTKDDGSQIQVTISRPEGGTIAVQLSNSTYQSYLAGVTVTANNGTSTFSATTDSSGYAEINVTESGTYTVSPTSEYFNPSSSSCDITYRQNLNFSLEAISYDLGTLSRGSQYYVVFMSDIKTSLGANTTTYSGGKAYATSTDVSGSARTPDGFLPRFHCRMKTSGMDYSGSTADRNAYVFNVNRTTFYNKVKAYIDSAIGGNTSTINTRGHRLKIDWVVSFRWNSISDFDNTYSFQTIDSYDATATTIYGTNGQLESYSFGAFSAKSSYTIACDSSSDTIVFSPEHIYGNITVL